MANVILPTMSNEQLQDVAKSETLTAKNALNPAFGAAEFLRDLQSARIPEDVEEQLYYIEALQRQVEQVQAQLATARDFIIKAEVNLKMANAALKLKKKLGENN